MLAAVIAPKKATRRRNIIALFAARIILDVVHIHVVDARAAILPGLASIPAHQYAAVFKQDKEQILIVGMNENMAHVGKLDAYQPSRHAPFLLRFLGESSMLSNGSQVCRYPRCETTGSVRSPCKRHARRGGSTVKVRTSPSMILFHVLPASSLR